jgi:putative DNA base modification enzyme with NMAD domain
MRAVLVRVGADTTLDGGGWNAPVNSRNGLFAYVPIPESRQIRPGGERPYWLFEEAVSAHGRTLPRHLLGRNAHVDPDFEHLTYGHPKTRARRILELGRGDLLVCYSGLQDITRERPLVYALIGLLVVDEVIEAGNVPAARYDENAHTRREPVEPTDVIVRGRPGFSGRLERCIPFCEHRTGGYRALRSILDAWGGISTKDGFVGRAPWLIAIGDPQGFVSWFHSHERSLLNRNN